MIEYLHNAIRATAGEDITLAAKITDGTGSEHCHISLYNDQERLCSFDGVYTNGIWEFTIPADATANLIGRYWYCICDGSKNHTKLNFKQPIYLV